MHRVQIDLVQFVRREEIGLAGQDGYRVSGLALFQECV